MNRKNIELISSASSKLERSEQERLLVNRLLQYDNLAWKEFLNQTILPLANTYKYRQTLQRFQLDIEDLISMFYSIIHKDQFARLRKFNYKASLRTWCYNIMHDAYGKILDKYERKKKKIQIVPSENALDSAQSNMKDGFQELRSQETKKELNRKLAMLWDKNPKHALTFLLREQFGYSSKEVGVLLGETEENVNTMKKRAVISLRKFGDKKNV